MANLLLYYSAAVITSFKMLSLVYTHFFNDVVLPSAINYRLTQITYSKTTAVPHSVFRRTMVIPKQHRYRSETVDITNVNATST